MKKWTLAILIGLLVCAVAVQTVGSHASGPRTFSIHSKLGIHGIRPDGILGFVQNAVDGGTRFSVVKAVDDLSYLAAVKDASLDSITVGRFTHEHEGAGLVNDPNTNLEWYAGVIMDVILDKIDHEPELAGVVDYWEPINEPLGGGTSAAVYARLARLMIYCMDIADQHGLKLALFSFNAGTPEWVDMEAIVATGVVARAKAVGHILAAHEGVFGNDPIDRFFPGLIPGAPDIPNAGALCGRYCFLYHLLKQRDEVVPLFISEFYAGGGYGDGADLNDIVQRMVWYDNLLRGDGYALGFAPFTLGPTSQWVNQNYEFAYPALVEYMIGVANSELVWLPLVASGRLNLEAGDADAAMPPRRYPGEP